VRRAECIVFAFGTLCEPGQTAAGAQRANAIAPSRQNFVRVSLVTDVPNQLVRGCVKNVVEGNRQLDDTEARSKVSAGDGDRVDGFGAQFIRNLLQVPRIDTAKIRRALDGVENGRVWVRQKLITGRRHVLIILPRSTEALLPWQTLTEYILPPNPLFDGVCHEVSSQRQSMTRAKVPDWIY
jgi:hypothetical protein